MKLRNMTEFLTNPIGYLERKKQEDFELYMKQMHEQMIYKWKIQQEQVLRYKSLRGFRGKLLLNSKIRVI